MCWYECNPRSPAYDTPASPSLSAQLQIGVIRVYSQQCQYLVEPHTGFHVAFKMLDADGNEMVEKKEFFKVSRF
ncbi:EF-hand domain-containing family member A1 [Myotis davidii]|uniref:EF-hand domain-containing family member A1 n=1 Tax=Myotis davidii TaxID=225400 RepID=L5MJB2_MYODS|nr:EF-hand domain-containing family member A1 [Myotis davidii]